MNRIKEASNPNTLEYDLRKLALSKDYRIQIAVATNPNTPLDVIKLFLKQDNVYVVKEICKSPNTKLEILKECIAKYQDYYHNRYYAILAKEICELATKTIAKKLNLESFQ